MATTKAELAAATLQDLEREIKNGGEVGSVIGVLVKESGRMAVAMAQSCKLAESLRHLTEYGGWNGELDEQLSAAARGQYVGDQTKKHVAQLREMTLQAEKAVQEAILEALTGKCGCATPGEPKRVNILTSQNSHVYGAFTDDVNVGEEIKKFVHPEAVQSTSAFLNVRK